MTETTIRAGDIPCPKCEAEAGWACINRHANPYRRGGKIANHADRIRAAAKLRKVS